MLLTSHRTILSANLGAKLIQAGSTAVAVPIFANLLGAESYGVLGFIATLTGFLAYLDLSLPVLLNRLVAHQDPQAANIALLSNRLLWGIGGALGVSVAVASPYLTEHWLTAVGLPADQVTAALLISSTTLILRFPVALRSAAVQSTSSQGTFNVLVSMVTIGQNGVGIILLVWVGADLVLLVAWQAIAAVILFLVVDQFWMRCFVRTSPAAAPWTQLLGRWRYLAGMTIASLFSCLFLVSDRLVASTQLSLGEFAHYSLAATAAGFVTLLLSPLTAAYFPVLCRHIADGDESSVLHDYRFLTWFIVMCMLPAAAALIAFSVPLFGLVFHDHAIASGVAKLCPLLIMGTVMGSMAIIPYQLQLAHGVTRAVILINSVLCVVGPPLYWFAAGRWGDTGCAAIFALMSACNLVAHLLVTHRRWLHGSLRLWFLMDFCRPLAICVTIALVIRLLWQNMGADPLLGCVGAFIVFMLGLTTIYTGCRPGSRG